MQCDRYFFLLDNNIPISTSVLTLLMSLFALLTATTQCYLNNTTIYPFLPKLLFTTLSKRNVEQNIECNSILLIVWLTLYHYFSTNLEIYLKFLMLVEINIENFEAKKATICFVFVSCYRRKSLIKRNPIISSHLIFSSLIHLFPLQRLWHDAAYINGHIFVVKLA